MCIGDINRQKPQERRGGGTNCLKNKKIAKLFQSAVGRVEDCKGIVCNDYPLLMYNIYKIMQLL